jgi:phosphatidylserine/phosphatidylglycerophosphate/cardiolipin synthase-like enzyme
MKAVAFANNDVAVVAWTFGGKLQNCLGFAVYRVDVRAGTETCLPALATFKDQQATPGRTTADDPVQKFFWKDVYAKRGGTYQYKIVPMTGKPGSLQPMSYGPAISNQILLGPHYGALSAYFNRGILATQATAHVLNDGSAPGSLVDRLKAHIVKPGDPLRTDLAGQMIEALTTLSDEAEQDRADVFCALYEFQDPEAIQHLAALKGNAHLILSNMPGTDEQGAKTNDSYAPERAEIRADGADVVDRFMPSGHIGHNKFQVLDNQGSQAVLFGSTNWTSNGLCAQTNNSIIARSPGMAAAYLDYWNRLKDDTKPPGEEGKAQQGAALRQKNAEGAATITLEDGSGTVDLWFSPNTPKARSSGKKRGSSEAVPPDLKEVFDAIAKAQQAIVFLAFQPGSPSIVEVIADALKAKPSLFVRGAVTASQAAGAFYTAIHGGSTGGPAAKRAKGDPPLPEDYRVIRATGVNKGDAFAQWEAELNQAGHAVIHDKIVVVDPFSDNCVVVTGSHNLGYTASYNNDENMAIIRGHRGIAEAYAAHCLDVYDHYAWRYWLSQGADKSWHFLGTDDSWQDGYFSPDNQVKSAELAFWLAATPAANALPTPSDTGSARSRPALQAQTGGVSPAVGPHAVAARPARGTRKPAQPAAQAARPVAGARATAGTSGTGPRSRSRRPSRRRRSAYG